MKIDKLTKQLKTHFQNNNEFKTRNFISFSEPCVLWFLESIANEEFLSSEIIKPLTEQTEENLPSSQNNNQNENNQNSLESKQNSSSAKIQQSFSLQQEESTKQNSSTLTFEQIESVITGASVNKCQNLNTAKEKLAVGSGIVFFEKSQLFVEVPVKIVPRRAIVEPPTNSVVRGPREGFIEDYKTNISLIRARLTTNKLKMIELDVGDLTKTKVCVTYLKDIASPDVVNSIIKKIKKIKIDGIIDSYYIESFLSEHPKSFFKQCGSAEKPDIVVAKMLEGRVAIIVDGSPFVLTLPFILIEDLQSSEDYYDTNIKVSFIRFLRVLGVLIATIMPGIYISFQVYHYKALPLKFLVTVLNAAYNIPFAPVAEVLFAFLLFEILYEASVRIPKGLGSSFNIIGALILGDTAVQSNLASAPTIMVVAVSSIALYLVPDQTSVLRMIRITLTIIGGVMGIIGIVLGLLFLVTYLCDFDNYGAAYLGPYAPRIKGDLKDAIIKKSVGKMKTRPRSIPNIDRNRVHSNEK